MKKILFVSPDIERGGIASVVNNIYNALDNKKYSVDFVCFNKPSYNYENKMKENGSNIFVIERFSKSGFIKHIKNIRKIIRENKYDVIHVHTSLLIWVSCIAAKLEGVNIRIGHAHGKKFLNYPELVLKFIERPFRYLNRVFCTNIITCSEESGIYTFGKNAEFVPNFINENEILNYDKKETEKILKTINIPINSKILGYAGCLDGIKNTEYFVKLLKQVRLNGIDSYLLLLGDGKSMSDLKEKFEVNGLSRYVRFLGYRNDINNIMPLFDIYVSASLSEGMSMSIIQAQMLGIPCIVSNGISDINDIGLSLLRRCDTYEIEEWVQNISLYINKKIKIKKEYVLEKLSINNLDRSSSMNIIKKIYNGELND